MKEEIQESLVAACNSWLALKGVARDPDLKITVDPVPPNISGDLASSIPLAIAKKHKLPPREVAAGIQAEMLKKSQDVLEKTELAGPGFLNFHLKTTWLLEELRSILNKREAYARRAPSGAGPVLLEFVSANPNGPLHVGHGRGAALGDSLARIFNHLGYEVSTEYYVNDVGNQMENLAVSVMWRCIEIEPAYLDDAEKAAVQTRKPDDLYKGDYLKDVARDIMTQFPPASNRSRGIDFFRKTAMDCILRMIREDLARFRVSFGQWFSESQLYGRNVVDRALKVLSEGGYLKEEEGALWFLSTRFGDDKDRVIKRKDERPTYFASDIAYHLDKFERGFKQLIDVWGTDHHGYVARVKAAVKALGQDPEALTILLYQLVTLLRDGKPVSMSTRSGEFVTLREVMEEVGPDACRFFFAMRGPNSHLEFDLDLAKKQAPENPVFYVQYVHARCCSIFREAEKRGVVTTGTERFPSPASLEPAERALLVKLASYPDIVELCRRDMSPHHITTFLLSLASEFHRFYENCRVLADSPQTTAYRLALVDGVRTEIRNGLSLLGVSAPEEM